MISRAGCLQKNFGRASAGRGFDQDGIANMCISRFQVSIIKRCYLKACSCHRRSLGDDIDEMAVPVIKKF
jgi:hypothetical protein